LWRVNNDGSYGDVSTTCVLQEQGSGGSSQSGNGNGNGNSQSQGGTLAGQALTVRGVKSTSQAVTLNGTATTIPSGAGLSGRVLIQIVDDAGNTFDVTQQILSMGMTVGEPNAIVTLQRPLWAAFTQGSRDSTGSQQVAPDGTAYFNSLTDIVTKTNIAADGEIQTSPGPIQHGTYGFLVDLVDDDAAQPVRPDNPPYLTIADWGTANWSNYKNWNAIVPINVYNVREGCINAVNCDVVYERGITNVVEINMRNLARWIDGVYDTNLLANTAAVSATLANPGGFTVYVSDRRGDKVKPLVAPSGATINATNGMVDNEDIYGPNGTLEAGEDVQEKGFLVKDITELPDPVMLAGNYGTNLAKRGLTVAAWTNPSNYFRHAVRLFNAEDLQPTGAAGRLSATEGITVSSENLVYTWGNYNTTGINIAPPAGFACLVDGSGPCTYRGAAVPASIVSDAFFPLSKTWSDNASAMFPGDLNRRLADRNLAVVTDETSVRAGIIAGNNLSALIGNPDAGHGGVGESRLNGGMHNFPRFLERWNARWNFAGSLIPLYHSTQALGQYNADSSIYSPPIRNWAFDSTFLDPNRLPPATPQFQYIQPTAFRQIL
jgi:hypothetical protein